MQPIATSELDHVSGGAARVSARAANDGVTELEMGELTSENGEYVRRFRDGRSIRYPGWTPGTGDAPRYEAYDPMGKLVEHRDNPVATPVAAK